MKDCRLIIKYDCTDEECAIMNKMFQDSGVMNIFFANCKKDIRKEIYKNYHTYEGLLK